jgi:hypothetical protein
MAFIKRLYGLYLDDCTAKKLLPVSFDGFKKKVLPVYRARIADPGQWIKDLDLASLSSNDGAVLKDLRRAQDIRNAVLARFQPAEKPICFHDLYSLIAYPCSSNAFARALKGHFRRGTHWCKEKGHPVASIFAAPIIKKNL